MTDNPGENAKNAVNHHREGSHTVSGDTKAPSLHTIAVMQAQKEKNEITAASRSMHKTAGRESHKISYDAKTGVQKAATGDARATITRPPHRML